MTEWDLPTEIDIDGITAKIRNKCDYRVVLDVIGALTDVDLSDEDKLKCALYIFYESLDNISNFDRAIEEMLKIVGGGENDETSGNRSPIMDWEHDFKLIVPPVNRVLGYDIRTPGKYTHWYTLLGGYMEIGDCTFATVVSIRSKRQKGKKLEKWEVEYLREHKKEIDLPKRVTAEEQAELDADW